MTKVLVTPLWLRMNACLLKDPSKFLERETETNLMHKFKRANQKYTCYGSREERVFDDIERDYFRPGAAADAPAKKVLYTVILDKKQTTAYKGYQWTNSFNFINYRNERSAVHLPFLETKQNPKLSSIPSQAKQNIPREGRD